MEGWKISEDGGDLVRKPDTRNTSKSRYSGVRKSKSEEVEKVKNISRGVVRMNQILTIEEGMVTLRIIYRHGRRAQPVS